MTASDTPTLDEVIAAYLDELDRGSDVEAHEFVSRWPEHRTEFLKFVERNLRFRNWTHENTGQLQSGPVAGSPTNFLDQRRIGPYRLERQIGRGGMSRVFQATRLDGGGQAALKMLDGGLTAEPTAEQRFRREAQAIQHVEHPHIVPLLDYGTDGGYSYLALQLIDGCTLADLIHWKKQDAGWGAADSGDVTAYDSKTLASTDRPDPSISPKVQRKTRSSDIVTKGKDTEQNEKVAAIWRELEISHPGCEYFAQISALVAQACGALQAAHDQGVVHRDIKPSNLMLDRSGHVWLTDFGLASMGEAHTVVTHTGQVIGTPNYMSPEQATGDSRQIDQRSDVYSMGATLYELATLHRPHDGERFRVLLEIAAGKLRAPSKLNPQIPRPLEAIILKAMSHRPEDRYASAADLAEDLLRFKAGDAVSARLPGTADRLMRWTVANPRKTLGIGTAVVLTGLLIMLTQFFHGQRLSLLNERLARANQQLNVSQQRLSRQVYVSDVAAAFRAYAQGDTDASRQFLSRHVPSLSGQNEVRDQRGFEWWLLDRLSSPTQPVLLGKHDEEATDVAVLPNGKELLTVGHDGCLRRWSIKDPGVLRELNIGDKLDALAISPNG
ncbi:MAG: serine/threonine-protein kinase, partial [bacterium]|nr:serine/threonine-protein kinase [bacterium]